MEGKEHACNYTKDSIMEVFIIRLKNGTDSKKNIQNFFLENVAHWIIISRTSNYQDTKSMLWIIFHLTPSIYAFRRNCFHINDKTYSINNIIDRCRHLEIIKEKYGYLNFQTLKKLTQYSCWAVI